MSLSSNNDEKNDEHKVASPRVFIDHLAARILDFDLRYVLKRMEQDEDEHKRK